MSTIQHIHGREILDSRGNPTVEVHLRLVSGAWGQASVPSGASTGSHEAHELRDGDMKRFLGKGVLKALNHIRGEITKSLEKREFSSQRDLDQALISLDGTKNKLRLGANGVLGVSMAFAKAVAMEQWQYSTGSPQSTVPFQSAEFSQPFLFESLAHEVNVKNFKLPTPLMNVFNGGAHANNGMDVQEFMLVPVGGDSFRENLRAGCEVFQNLKKLLDEKGHSTAVGDEGGFAPSLNSSEEALSYLAWAVEKSGYRLGEDIQMALDVAATELFQGETGAYSWGGKQISSDELGEIYSGWLKKYPLVSIEDGFSEDDWEGWKLFTQSHGNRVQIVGDDLLVTHTERLERGIDQKAANSILIKINQRGTLTEAWEAVKMAHKAGWTTVMSHRSGETEDATISDLAVAWACPQIKTGSPCRGERTAKYNQLLRIEEQIHLCHGETVTTK